MWRRLPTYFPNMRLRMLPINSEDYQQLCNTGWLREAVFRCEPQVNKLEIKAFLERVHGMKVERVSTLNVQGRKKRKVDWTGKPHWYRQTDWKKAYVLFEPPEDIKQKWLEDKQKWQLEQLQELQKAASEGRRPPDYLPTAAAALAKEAAPAVAAAATAAIAAAKHRDEQSTLLKEQTLPQPAVTKSKPRGGGRKKR